MSSYLLTSRTLFLNLNGQDGLTNSFISQVLPLVSFLLSESQLYRKDTEPLYHSFMYSLVLLLSGIYPLHISHGESVTYIDGSRAVGRVSLSYRPKKLQNRI